MRLRRPHFIHIYNDLQARTTPPTKTAMCCFFVCLFSMVLFGFFFFGTVDKQICNIFTLADNGMDGMIHIFFIFEKHRTKFHLPLDSCAVAFHRKYIGFKPNQKPHSPRRCIYLCSVRARRAHAICSRFDYHASQHVLYSSAYSF